MFYRFYYRPEKRNVVESVTSVGSLPDSGTYTPRVSLSMASPKQRRRTSSPPIKQIILKTPNIVTPKSKSRSRQRSKDTIPTASGSINTSQTASSAKEKSTTPSSNCDSNDSKSNLIVKNVNPKSMKSQSNPVFMSKSPKSSIDIPKFDVGAKEDGELVVVNE